MALTNKLTAIGDAVREKTGKSEKLTLDAMAVEIKGIQTGGGSGGGGSSSGGDFTNEEVSGLLLSERNNKNLKAYMDALKQVEQIPSSYFRYPSIWVSSSDRPLVDASLLRQMPVSQLTKLGDKSFESLLLQTNWDTKGESLYIVDWSFDGITGGQGTGYDYGDYPFGMQCDDNHNIYCVFRFPNLIAEDALSNREATMRFLCSCYPLKEVYFPKLKGIGDTTFSSNDYLEKIDFGESFEKMDTSAWGCVSYCSQIKTVIIRNPNKVVECTMSIDKIFQGCSFNENNPDAFFYVPKALVEQYKVATNWSVWADKIRAIEDYPEICGGAA